MDPGHCYQYIHPHQNRPIHPGLPGMHPLDLYARQHWYPVLSGIRKNDNMRTISNTINYFFAATSTPVNKFYDIIIRYYHSPHFPGNSVPAGSYFKSTNNFDNCGVKMPYIAK